MKQVETIGGVSSTGKTSLIYESIYNDREKPSITYAVRSGGKTTTAPFLMRGPQAIVPPT
jgi:hypothetical protein